MLEFVDFSLKFKDKDKLVTVVKKLNFKIEKGERFALVGESGSGQSVTYERFESGLYGWRTDFRSA